MEVIQELTQKNLQKNCDCMDNKVVSLWDEFSVPAVGVEI